jgi:hypothetical protein
VLTLSQRRGDVRTSLVARVNRQAMSEVETFWDIKGQLSILLRLTEFVRDRKLSKLSNKAIAEILHALIRDAPELPCSLGPRASVVHQRCTLRDLTWVTLSQLQVRRSVQAVCFCDRFFTLNHLCVYHIGGVSKHLCVYLRSYVCVFGEFVCMYVHVCVFCHDLLHIFVHRRLHLTILVIPVESDRRRRIHSYSIAVNSRRCIQHDVTCACVCVRAL